MKKTIPTVITLFTGVSLLFSCSNAKQIAAERKMAMENSRIPTVHCFVQLIDGTVKEYSSLKLVTGIYKTPHLVADGKTSIYPNDIIAYQNDEHYAVFAGGFSYGGHKSNVSVQTLPGFAVRIAAGKLNVYAKKYQSNNRVVDEFYLQEGNGQVLAYTPELMDALIKNNPEALEFFNNNHKQIRLTKQLKTTAYIFNNAYFAAKSPKKTIQK